MMIPTPTRKPSALDAAWLLEMQASNLAMTLLQHPTPRGRRLAARAFERAARRERFTRAVQRLERLAA